MNLEMLCEGLRTFCRSPARLHREVVASVSSQRSCSLSAETSDGKPPRVTGILLQRIHSRNKFNEGYETIRPSSHVGLRGRCTTI